MIEGLVLANVGATAPRRDPVDTRIVNDVANRTGRAGIGSGYPVLASTTPPLDADRDGMPDLWEKAHGLDGNDGADGAMKASNGYTNVENYLNCLAGDPVAGVCAAAVRPAPPTGLRVG